MSKTPALHDYQAFYQDMGFERAAVFQAVARRYAPRMALYPGSSVHITPSFYIPHVVYVDLRPAAQRFFAHAQDVLALVNHQKTYRRSAFVHFLAQDYTKTLPLADQSFDLLIALYAGGIARACQRYLKIGGLLLSNNHHDDAGEAARSGEYELVAVIPQEGERCHIVEDDLTTYLIPKSPVTTRAHAHYAAPRPDYTRRAAYYLLQRLPPR